MNAAGRSAWARWWPAGLAWALWALAMLGVATIPWFDHLLRQARRSELIQLTPPPSPGASRAGRGDGRGGAGQPPATPPGRLAAAGAGAGGDGLRGGRRLRALRAAGPARRAPRRSLAGHVQPATIYLAFVCIGFVLLLTPSGSLPSPRWRWWARLAAAAPVGFLLALAVGPGLVIAPYDAVIDQVSCPRWPARWRRDRRGRSRSRSAAWRSGLVAGGALPPRPRGGARAAALGGVRGRADRAAGGDPPVRRRRGHHGGGPGRPGGRASAWRCCRWRSARRSCATGCTTWTGSSAAPWPMGCSRCCWAAATPWWFWGSASCWAGTPAWSWPERPWPWRRCSSRPVAASRRRSTGASTGAATTPPRRSQAFSARLREQVDLDTLTAELLAVVDQTMQPTQVSLWLRPSVAPPSARQPTPASWTLRTTL